MMSRFAKSVPGLLAVFLLVAPAQADLHSATDLPLTGPGTVQVSLADKGQLTSSLAMGVTEENSAQLFFEKGSFIAGSDLALTLGGSVPVGTYVNSYILHFDPVGRSSSPVYEYHGTLTFDETILGVIYDTASVHGLMVQSDSSVGLGAGYYDASYSNRKFEYGQSQWGDVAILGSSVTFNLFTNSGVDEVRIITTPIPGAALLGSLGLGLSGWLCRRRRQTRA
jgi:hypothetical protein